MLPRRPGVALAALRVQRRLNAEAVRGIKTNASNKPDRQNSQAAASRRAKEKVPKDVRQATRDNRQQEHELRRLKVHMQAAYGQPIASIALDSCPTSSTPIDSKADPEYIASWNVDTAQSVYIPGEPPLLTTSASSVVLRKTTAPPPDFSMPSDDGGFAKALLKSVRSLTPDFRFKTLDIFTWGKNLVRLSQVKGPFIATKVPGGPMLLRFGIRFPLQETVFPASSGEGKGARSIANSMTRQYTELPSSHFRVIRYMFGNLSLGVPARIDAWNPVHKQENSTPEHLPTAPKSEPNTVFSGQLAKQSELVWLKDDAKGFNPQAKSYFMKAWFSRVQHMRLGSKPSNGGRVHIRNVSLDMALGEAENQESFQQIHHVLSELKTSMAKTSTGIICGIPVLDKGGRKYWELYEVDDKLPAHGRETAMAKELAEYDADPTTVA